MRDHVNDIAARRANVRKAVFYEEVGHGDQAGRDYDHRGRVDLHAIRDEAIVPGADYYLCGPAAFMRAQREALLGLGVTEDRIHAEAWKPYSEQKLSFEDAVTRGSEPLRAFMLRQTREADLALFQRISGKPPAATPAEIPMRVLVPAFVTSELKTAFQIGFMVFIPFIVIDLIVASVLMSMGMMMLSPVLIALPFKLMLFVLADGWNLLIGSLVASFGSGP